MTEGKRTTEERVESLEEMLYDLFEQRESDNEVGTRMYCIDRAITTLTGLDGTIHKVSAIEIVEYAKEYYKYVMEDVSTSNNS